MVGKKLKLVNDSFIEDFATRYLIQNYPVNNLAIIKLAYGVNNDYLLQELLEKIVYDLNIPLEENSENWEMDLRKWRFALLYRILNNNYSNKRILEEIENIYCDFDHPEELNEFIIYIPSEPIEGYDFQQHSAEENFAFMVGRFKKFLFKEQQELSNKN